MSDCELPASSSSSISCEGEALSSAIFPDHPESFPTKSQCVSDDHRMKIVSFSYGLAGSVTDSIVAS